MRKSSYLLRLALLLLLAAAAAAPLRRASAQTGLEQTPIDVRDEDATFVENMPALGFSYGTKVTLRVVNTGSPGEFATVRAVVPEADQSSLTVADVNSDEPKTYKLLQFHWHTPSEHRLNGEEFPMEMHFVHQLGADGPYTVVGVFIRQGKENKELKKLFNDLPAVKDEGRVAAKVNLTRLLPGGLESYRYNGSLTTPDPGTGVFKEGIRWVVLAEPVEMSAEQINAFKALFPDGNSRELQPLNGRTVYTDVEPAANN